MTHEAKPDLLTTGELARRVAKSREWVLKEIRAGRLLALRTEGGAYVVPYGIALDFVAKRAVAQ